MNKAMCSNLPSLLCAGIDYPIDLCSKTTVSGVRRLYICASNFVLSFEDCRWHSCASNFILSFEDGKKFPYDV